MQHDARGFRDVSHKIVSAGALGLLPECEKRVCLVRDSLENAANQIVFINAKNKM